jgi:demethylmenaquinone methyltransferase/2-methoxy-6-polyprenyl-1,4-benzoquinol methylase
MNNISEESKKEAYVEGLFSSIASKYDLLNSVMSLHMHKAWRRFAVGKCGVGPGSNALDVCCGTGDFAIELAKAVGEAGSVVGVDFSLQMLELAKQKVRRSGYGWVSFLEANACSLPFEDNAFDCVTVGFGLRNVADLGKAVSEMVRVTRPGGKIVCLEISKVTNPLLMLPWQLYFYVLTPYIARLFQGRKEAYEYLPRSVKGFVSREELAAEFERQGLRDVEYRDLTFGAVCVHVGTKPGRSCFGVNE